MSLLLLLSHLLCSLLCNLHTDLSTPSMCQATSCLKTSTLAILSAWDVHSLDTCLTCSLTSHQVFTQMSFSQQPFPALKLQHSVPSQPIRTLCPDILFLFFTIALIIIMYAKLKVFNCLSHLPRI